MGRPLWYFYNDRLNKKNELDHSTKYKLCYNYSTDNSAITLSDTTVVFVTVQDAHLKIIDNSKFTLSTTLIDNKRKMDDPTTSSSATHFYDDRGRILLVLPSMPMMVIFLMHEEILMIISLLHPLTAHIPIYTMKNLLKY